jgi:GTP-binding protein
VDVPVGTEIFDDAGGGMISDLDRPGLLVLVAKGGRGGRGNAAFATSTNQAPRRTEPGEPGVERTLLLELKVLADVGLIGYPNAGKSTLISVISAARPKIADYPFTTLTPNLGVAQCDDETTFVVADIPGLIEGAHSGSGLGDQFLRHVERTRVLVHLVDVSEIGPDDPVHALQAINRELRLYDPGLGGKPQIVTPSKVDAADHARLMRITDHCLQTELECQPVSAVTGEGIAALKRIIARRLAESTE